MRTLTWYFDFISPYAYLQSERLAEFDSYGKVELKPVLFAGLLGHFGQKGPAEIPGKREHTYRDAVWRAHRHGIPMKLPPAHPFNPLPMLRLYIALGGGRELLHQFFRYVWADGHLPTDPQAWADFTRPICIDDPADEIARPEVKEILHDNTAEAIERGVFGVPTLIVDDQRFWGFDSTEMALDYLNGQAIMTSPEMRRAGQLPDGLHRRVR